MKLFDSHCHLDDRKYNEDLDEVIKRGIDSGVAGVMIVGITKETSEKALYMAETLHYPGIEFYASVGIHPHDAKTCSESTLKYLSKLAKKNKVYAWGEIGLDFNRMYSPQKVQEHWLIKQIEEASKAELPLIFHERDSNGRFLEILKYYKNDLTKSVIHCFSGSKSELYEYLDLGLYIGITGIITIKKRGVFLREIAPFIPEDKILIETDAPYLTPAPPKNRTRRNEPAFVKHVLDKLALVRKQEPEYLSEKIWENTCNMYGIIKD